MCHRFEAANPYLRFDEVHGDQAKYELPPEEKSAFEEFKDAIETGGSLYKVRPTATWMRQS